MKTYIRSVLDRLENLFAHPFTLRQRALSRREFVPGEYLGIMVMVVNCEGKTIGVRGDKFNDFLMGTCDEHIKSMKVNLGCTMLEIIEGEEDAFYYARAAINPEMWKAQYADLPLPVAPVFKLVKPRDTLKWDYHQVQNFLWESVRAHPANPIPHEANNPCYLDIEYFLYLILGDKTYFDNAFQILIQYILHFTNGDSEFGREVDKRLTALHFLALQENNDTDTAVLH